MDHLSITSGQFVIYAIESFIMIIISLFSGILLLYTCMSLSMLANTHRGLVSFGAFIVITTVLQTIGALLISLGVTTNLFANIGRVFRNMGTALVPHQARNRSESPDFSPPCFDKFP